jgi:hypothetical protein
VETAATVAAVVEEEMRDRRDIDMRGTSLLW